MVSLFGSSFGLFMSGLPPFRIDEALDHTPVAREKPGGAPIHEGLVLIADRTVSSASPQRQQGTPLLALRAGGVLSAVLSLRLPCRPRECGSSAAGPLLF